ncbi:DUF4288 domain-containing protein [Heliobacterium undosum]|uniref:DUF4288 domain-containing protein n=1 Tax=Heliomicrobium undosum TaxID=121734 RepID=A0A845L9J4_9FIRM|nr:DUF4288 domain-containing protein [Heliomicrobium undosum]
MKTIINDAQKNWYAVKILFESIHSGTANLDKIDEADYDSSKKLYEESIILVEAATIKNAYEIAEEQAYRTEHEYLNTYEQLVKWRFVKLLHVFELNDNQLNSGTEVYSRFIHARKEDDIKDIINRYYPEALDPKEEPKPDG